MSEIYYLLLKKRRTPFNVHFLNAIDQLQYGNRLVIGFRRLQNGIELLYVVVSFTMLLLIFSLLMLFGFDPQLFEGEQGHTKADRTIAVRRESAPHASDEPLFAADFRLPKCNPREIYSSFTEFRVAQFRSKRFICECPRTPEPSRTSARCFALSVRSASRAPAFSIPRASARARVGAYRSARQRARTGTGLQRQTADR